MPEIRLTIRLHNALRRQHPHGWQDTLQLSLPARSAVGDLLATLSLSLPPEAILVVIDRRAVSPDHILRDGDTVHLLPAIAGG